MSLPQAMIRKFIKQTSAITDRKTNMKLAVAQINSTVGDLAGNADRILACAERAMQQGVRLLLTPELGLCGYPPEDLLLRDGF